MDRPALLVLTVAIVVMQMLTPAVSQEWIRFKDNFLSPKVAKSIIISTETRPAGTPHPRPPAHCEDLKDTCVEWVYRGYCNDPEYQTYMTIYCRKSCNKCPSTPGTPTATPPTSGTTAAPKVRDVWLPDSLVPDHYDVRLQPYMYNGRPEEFTFKGSVRMWFQCVTQTDSITLHKNVLTIDEASIRVSGGLGVTQVTYDEDRQFVIIHLASSMQPNTSYSVSMNFTSPLKKDLKGLYYSSYTRNGQPVYLATTQMEPTDARKTFPCMDEPAIKATFNVTLVRPQDRISLSNMPIIDSSETWTEDGITWVADKYQQSPKMSTYLLAFIICDFVAKEATTKYNVTFRTYAKKESINEVDYALSVGVKTIEHFQDYFDVDFPLPKLDMIPIPDFAAGAMENWGLVTYRETAMLYKQGVSTAGNKVGVAETVSHELAHMWFGNLVTMSWWNDLWLNEGFATYVSFMGVDHVEPEWKMFDRFVLTLQDTMYIDGVISSHPIYVDVRNPDEIAGIFDVISYYKGGSIVQMMRHFLGLETFRLGIKRYLTNRKYKTASHDDLWSALSEQALQDNKTMNGFPIDVKAVMDTWILQMNYPVVTVTRDFNNPDWVHVTQQRYLVDPQAQDPGKYTSEYDYKWTIPLTLTSHKTLNFDQTDADVMWMDHKDSSTSFHVGASNLPDSGDPQGWILANVDVMGFYRVNYDTGNWQALVGQLKANHSVIPVKNRAQIINDAWNIEKSGMLGLETALSTLEYLDKERDYVPWASAVKERKLKYISMMLSLSHLKGAFEKFMRAKLEPSYILFGLNNTARLASKVCKYGIPECLEAASKQYREWMDNPDDNRIDPDFREAMYCYGIQQGGWDEWKFALEKYKKEPVASEKDTLLESLSCSNQPWILNTLLHMLLEDNSPFRRQDSFRVVKQVASGPVGRLLAWNFYTANYDVIKEKLGKAPTKAFTKAFNTQFELDQIKEFEAAKIGDERDPAYRSVQQSKERTLSNIKWMAQNEGVLEAFLADKGYLV